MQQGTVWIYLFMYFIDVNFTAATAHRDETFTSAEGKIF